MKKKINKLAMIALICVIAITAAVVAPTLAYVFLNTGSLENEFVPSAVSCRVVETFNQDKTEKSEVKVQNTGDTKAYIRVAVVVSWKDATGNVYAFSPEEGKDFVLELSQDTNWAKKGDYHYYLFPVAAGNSTEDLIDRCYQKSTAPSGYSLSVEILASAIQAEPSEAVGTMWDLTVDADTGKILIG
jgi:hypothetical protein